MTVQPQKFLFETEFRADPRKEDARRVALEAERAAERDRSYAQGHAEGYAAGEQAALASIEQARLVAFSRIAEAMEHNMASLAAVEARLEAEARETCLAIAEKLAGTLIAREPLARLEALVGDCFANLRQVPHLVIRVHDSLLDDARASVEQMARERGFDGRLVFLAEPTIQPGDCRIEWANGGVILDRDAVMAAIAEVITRHCGPAPAPLPTFDAPTDEAQP